jgi:hypothetical protein
MDHQTTHEVAEWLSDSAGSFVRCAARYDELDVDILYMKPAVKALYSEREIQRIADAMRAEPRQSEMEGLLEMGQFNCSLWGFQDGIVLHFPKGERSGTVITLEAGIASQFNEFAEECAARIYDR